MSVILRTNQLTKRYAHRTVVDHLSMTIHVFSFSPCKLTQLKSCISGQNMPLSYELLSYCIKLLQYCPYTFIYPFILFAILSFSPIINIFPYVLLLSLRRNNADCVLKNFCNRIHICHCSDCQFFL